MQDFDYNSEKWQRKRAAILRRDKYQCQMCKRYGRITAATTVHHIKHTDEYPELAYDDANLMSVCGACHNKLHPEKGKRAAERREYKPREQAKYYIPKAIEDMSQSQTVILVCGLPASGKSTYVREHMGDGIAYDLDHIAAAFRLREPHEEYHEPSRHMANDLLTGFIKAAHRYSETVYVIRTAPTEEEMETIRPKRVVICTGHYETDRYYPDIDYDAIKDRLRQVVRWSALHNISPEYPPTTKTSECPREKR